MNEGFAERYGAYKQPDVIIDSINFAPIVQLQRDQNWDATRDILIASARRLVASGADVLAIAAVTMHLNYDAVASSVSVPVIDIRVCVADELQRRTGSNIAILGTAYVRQHNLYAATLRTRGLTVMSPNQDEQDELQRIIFEELTRGIVSSSARDSFNRIAQSCLTRGADVIGLCCTEFGILQPAREASYPAIDSMFEHVNALLEFITH